MRSDTQQPSSVAADSGKQKDAGPSRRWRTRRTLLTGALVLGAVAGLLALALLLTVRNVQEDLSRGRLAMERGRNQLMAGDATAASESFREGRQLFARAEDRGNGLVLGAVRWLPVVGRTGDAIWALSGAAVTAADAATVVADAVVEIGGTAGLAPAGGRIPLDHFETLAHAAREADRLMTRAVSELERAPTSLLLGPVGPARREAAAELDDLKATMHTAALVLRGLPAFLGAEKPQRYFFGAQNPAELRGTGGLIGAYSILEIDDGRFSFSPFVPIHSLAQPSLGTVPPPNEDYAANYDQFRRGGRFWTSINVMPDLPSVAQAILSSYRATTGEGLDGVILADPFAEQALLEVTGPVSLPGYDVELNADNVVDFTTNEAYSLFTDSVRRKRVLGDVASTAFERFLDQPSAGHEALRALIGAASDRHILVFSENPPMEQGLRGTPIGGALLPRGADQDLLSVVVSSGAGSKVDFYQERDIRYTVKLSDDGSAAAATELTLRNLAPTSGEPAYVIGPIPPEGEDAGPILGNLRAGESVALVNVYCGTDCVPREALLDGAPIRAATRVDLGMRYVQHYFAIRAGGEKTLGLSWDDPRAWEGNSSGGVFRMTYTGQVTIRPTTLHLRIEPPDDMQIVSASPPLRIVGGAAVYEGQGEPSLDIVVGFRPPVPLRFWRNVTRFLTTPINEI
jgi:hypothetical protein